MGDNGRRTWSIFGSSPAEPLFSCDTCEVLNDVRQGWPDNCIGLIAPRIAYGTADQCRQACCADPSCQVWQFTSRGCFTGDGYNCRSTRNPGDITVLAGQRLSHGKAGPKVTGKLPVGKQWCNGLKSIDFNTQGHSGESPERCRDICYSDIGCSVWQYALGGQCYFGNSTDCSTTAQE